MKPDAILEQLKFLKPLLLIVIFMGASGSIAAPPDLKTPAPVIHLADNLDEKDQLGYCLDTIGRGFADKLHAHSCKPRGGDVQFQYNSNTKQIESSTFEGKCVEILGTVSDGSRLGLLDCSKEVSRQKFDYDSNLLEFHPQSAQEFCLAVGEQSRRAGPFMARKLRILDCEKTDLLHKQWRILNP